MENNNNTIDFIKKYPDEFNELVEAFKRLKFNSLDGKEGEKSLDEVIEELEENGIASDFIKNLKGMDKKQIILILKKVIAEQKEKEKKDKEKGKKLVRSLLMNNPKFENILKNNEEIFNKIVNETLNNPDNFGKDDKELVEVIETKIEKTFNENVQVIEEEVKQLESQVEDINRKIILDIIDDAQKNDVNLLNILGNEIENIIPNNLETVDRIFLNDLENKVDDIVEEVAQIKEEKEEKEIKNEGIIKEENLKNNKLCDEFDSDKEGKSEENKELNEKENKNKQLEDDIYIDPDNKEKNIREFIRNDGKNNALSALSGASVCDDDFNVRSIPNKQKIQQSVEM